MGQYGGAADELREGASVTSAFVMPVSLWISGGMGPDGWTKVSKRSTTSLPTRRAAEISMRLQSLKERPVVSVSRTTTPSSSGPKSADGALSTRVRYLSRTSSGVPGSMRSAREVGSLCAMR